MYVCMYVCMEWSIYIYIYIHRRVYIIITTSRDIKSTTHVHPDDRQEYQYVCPYSKYSSTYNHDNNEKHRANQEGKRIRLEGAIERPSTPMRALAPDRDFGVSAFNNEGSLTAELWLRSVACNPSLILLLRYVCS
jgi:hypothetical protein